MRALLDFLLPPRCRICTASTIGERLPWICQHCWGAIPLLSAPLCAQCGQPFAAPPEGIGTTTHRCGTCLLRPPPYEQARAVGLYHGVLRDAIHVMKYQGVYGLIEPLAGLLQSQFARHWGAQQVDALIPVPLHRSKLREREFDQALALAWYLGKGVDIPVWQNRLIRQRRTISQVGLNATQRLQNVRGAFALKIPSACAGKGLLLIDDVYTTGATLQECARLLRQAGASWVGAYTLARVGEPQHSDWKHTPAESEA